ncbi:GNAT family N-acetyltransferase [Nocardia gipuzkoensis]
MAEGRQARGQSGCVCSAARSGRCRRVRRGTSARTAECGSAVAALVECRRRCRSRRLPGSGHTALACRSVDSEAEAQELIARWRAGWTNGSGPQWAVVVDDVVAARVALRNMSPSEGVSEIAYWTAPQWRGRGVTPAAVDRVTRWAFEVGFHRLEVLHSVHNQPSCRAAVKAGFALEGVKRGAALHADGWHDMHVHARIRPTYRPVRKVGVPVSLWEAIRQKVKIHECYHHCPAVHLVRGTLRNSRHGLGRSGDADRG